MLLLLLLLYVEHFTVNISREILNRTDVNSRKWGEWGYVSCRVVAGGGWKSGNLFLLRVAGASILLANHSDLFVSKVCEPLQVTRSVIFGSKFAKNRLPTGLRPDPLGNLQRSPNL